MPAAETTGGRRSAKLLQLLFWAGVGLTPLAALLLLVGSGFVLQVAAVLAVLVVLLIGLSIALRRDSESVRGDVEEMLYEEIDTLRDDIRGDITHAARATHGQLVERIGVLHQTVDALRNQVDVMRGQIERAAAQQQQQPPPQQHPTGSAAVPQGVLRHTETVQVTTKTMVVDPTEGRHDGTVYGAVGAAAVGAPAPSVARPDIPQQRRPDRSERISERDRPGRAERGAAPGHTYGGARGPERGPERGPDPEHAQHADRAERSARYERPERIGRSERSERSGWTERSERSEWIERPARAEPSRPPEPSRPAEPSGRPARSGRAERPERPEPPREESWTEQLLRERMAGGGRADSGAWPQTQPGEVERTGGRRRAQDPDDEGNLTGLRTTDRWASVHSDEHGGRELRMGERRSAMHADETGTRLSIEDRWASVRHEEFYADEPRTGGALGGGHRDDRLPAGGHRDDRFSDPGGSGERSARYALGGHRDDRDDRHERHERHERDDRHDESRRESPRRSEARRERERDWSTGEHTAEHTGGHAARGFGGDWGDRSGGFDGGHRDEPRTDTRWSQASYEEGRRDETGATRWSEVRRDRPAVGGPQAALPASPAEPASRWMPGLAGPGREDERVSRRARAQDDDEYGWNGGRDEPRGRAARQIVNFEGNDDRWR